MQLSNDIQALIKEDGDYGKGVLSALFALGLSPKFKGFCYVLSAILSYHHNPAQSISKDIYPAVSRAQSFGVSPAQVERNIRSVIQAAWNSRDEAVWAKFFHDSQNISERKPTNLEFISQIAWRIEFRETRSGDSKKNTKDDIY